jgi:DNA processing protein
MNVNIHKLNAANLPAGLVNIHTPPQQLYWAGRPIENWLDTPKLAIVGSRKMSAYGKGVTTALATAAARAGITIISGLAYGVDATAHQAALEAGAICVAVLPTSLNNIYPSAHRHLAEKIAGQGTLLSEYGADDPIYQVNFVARNRLISGLSDAVLITEASLRSGSLATANFALEQGKTVMAVPGNINSPGSEGCNNLIKSGAIPVTSAADIFLAMGIKPAKAKQIIFRGTPHEEALYKLISGGIADQDNLALESRLSGPELSNALTGLELAGYIRPAGAGNWMLSG